MKIEFGRVQKTRPHLFADALEIMCVYEQSPVSKTDAISLLSSSIAPADELLNVEEEDLDENDVADDVSSAEITERQQGYIDECFRQIEYRAGAFGNSYPFSVENEILVLKNDLTVDQFLYIFLLSASRIRTFKGSQGLMNRIADEFEFVCRDALRHLMNERSEVVMFGPNSHDRQNRFDSNLRIALPMLADFMGMQMAPHWNPDNVAAQGDGKIDLVGVQKLDDEQGGWNVFLGQCAAREEDKDWEKKRLEADISYHSSNFHFSVKSQAVLFIPTCFRQPDGRWVNPASTSNVIVMDRLRILRNFQDNDPSGASAMAFVQQELLAALAA